MTTLFPGIRTRPREEIVLPIETWRAELKAELIATAGLGHDEAGVVALRALQRLVDRVSTHPPKEPK